MSKGIMPKSIDTSFTGMQKYIQNVLVEKNHSVEDIIGEIVKISKEAEKPTPTGDIVEDAGARLNANKMLLELAGVYKSRGGINLNFDINSILYDKTEQTTTSAEVI